MSEKQLKIIFALTVLLFVLLGTGGKNDKLASEKSDFNTASLIAQNEILAVPYVTKSNAESATPDQKPASDPTPKIVPSTSTLNIAEKEPASPPKPKYPILNAQIFLISDLQKRDNIFEFKANQRWPIASITKLMTALVALQNIPPHERITINDYALSTEGSAGEFKLGETYSLIDLIKALLVASSNDAAAAVQDFYGRDKFLELMNEKARSLNMLNTNFNESSGLSAINQSSANDLKILVNYIYENQKNILDISTEKEVSILDLNSNSSKILKNINPFAGTPDFLGGKTGFINESGGNLVTVFLRSGRPIITVVFGAGDRIAETKKLIGWFDEIY